MRILYLLAAFIWAGNFLRYLNGSFHPDEFMIGFSMFLSMMFFIALYAMQGTHKTENRGKQL